MAEEARRKEIAEARTQILAIMRGHGLTVADLGGCAKQTRAARKPVEIKYKDEATGNTRTDRGQEPKWLKGKDKNRCLVR